MGATAEKGLYLGAQFKSGERRVCAVKQNKILRMKSWAWMRLSLISKKLRKEIKENKITEKTLDILSKIPLPFFNFFTSNFGKPAGASGSGSSDSPYCFHPPPNISKGIAHPRSFGLIGAAALVASLNLSSCTPREDGNNPPRCDWSDWSDWTIAQQPTCLDTGFFTRTRNNGCGISETDTLGIAALGHNWSEYDTSITPTCETIGEEKSVCLRELCTEYRTRPLIKKDGCDTPIICEKCKKEDCTGNCGDIDDPIVCNKCGKKDCNGNCDEIIYDKDTITLKVGREGTNKVEILLDTKNNEITAFWEPSMRGLAGNGWGLTENFWVENPDAARALKEISDKSNGKVNIKISPKNNDGRLENVAIFSTGPDNDSTRLHNILNAMFAGEILARGRPNILPIEIKFDGTFGVPLYIPAFDHLTVAEINAGVTAGASFKDTNKTIPNIHITREIPFSAIKAGNFNNNTVTLTKLDSGTTIQKALEVEEHPATGKVTRATNLLSFLPESEDHRRRIREVTYTTSGANVFLTGNDFLNGDVWNGDVNAPRVFLGENAHIMPTSPLRGYYP